MSSDLRAAGEPAGDDVAIRVGGLSKRHEIYAQPRDRLKQFVLPRLQSAVGRPPRQYFREFWAVRDVSFEVRRGESLAIIGRNGSGKSTLLQMICGTSYPTLGSVDVNGRVAALLELGAGFNMDFTGRENVYLNGAILGLSAAEIDARLDDILAFADIGSFIDQPVKTYSSGMYVRLAFAIQVNVDPEILVVDEALSVGDFFFQQKCFARIREMRERGLTLLFVSHDMGTVRDLCPRAVYLRQGEAAFIGDSNEAIRRYLAEVTPAPDRRREGDAAAAVDAGSAEWLQELTQLAAWRGDPADTQRRLLAVVLRDQRGKVTSTIRMGQKVTMQVYFRTRPGEEGHITLTLKNKFDQIVSCTGSYFLGIAPLHTSPDRCGVLELSFDCVIEAGLYSMCVSFGTPGSPNKGTVLESTDWFGPIQVSWDYEHEVAPFLGQVGLPVSASFQPEVA